MNMADRIRIYLDRGLQEDEAAILLLIEEAGIAIFSAFPDQFVLFGGAALLLFYQSPRFSRHLQILRMEETLWWKQEGPSLVRKQIQLTAEVLGLGQLDIRTSLNVGW